LESVNFSTYGHVTTFRHSSGPMFAQCLVKTLWTSKRHTFRVSAFYRCRWFGAKLFPVGCAQDNRMVFRGKNTVQTIQY